MAETTEWMQMATYAGGAVIVVLLFLAYNRTLKPMTAGIAAVIVAGVTYTQMLTKEQIEKAKGSG